jgi:hypothetical protein
VHRWFRFKAVDKNISIILGEMESTPKYGSGVNGWALIADSQGPMVVTARVNYEFDGFIKDMKSEEGYNIPRRVRMAAIDEGGTSVTGMLLMKDIREIQDPSSNLDGVLKAIVRRFSKPRDYYINCTYTFKIKKGAEERTIQGEGFFRFTYVNP